MEAAGKLFPHTGRAGLGPSSLLWVSFARGHPVGQGEAEFVVCGCVSMLLVDGFNLCVLGEELDRDGLGECPGSPGSPTDEQGWLWGGALRGPWVSLGCIPVEMCQLLYCKVTWNASSLYGCVTIKMCNWVLHFLLLFLGLLKN